jgi:hypothetical protein
MKIRLNKMPRSETDRVDPHKIEERIKEIKQKLADLESEYKDFDPRSTMIPNMGIAKAYAEMSAELKELVELTKILDPNLTKASVSDLKFASETEALQHLADITGKTIKIEG